MARGQSEMEQAAFLCHGNYNASGGCIDSCGQSFGARHLLGGTLFRAARRSGGDFATAIGKLFKFQENWLQYRALVETLDREVEMHMNGVADYAKAEQADRNRLLVERVENLLATNTSTYVAAHRGDKATAPVTSSPTTNG